MKRTTILLSFLLTAMWSLAQLQQNDPYDVRFLEKGYGELDATFQKNLRSAAAWSSFDAAHPGWMVRFNEDSQLPSRAFGPGVQVNGTEPIERAYNFLESEAAAFVPDFEELQWVTTTDNGKSHQVFFKQVHEGMDVLFSKAMVKVTYEGKVTSWSTTLQHDITVATTASISPAEAAAAAMEGVNEASSPVVNGELKILPVPGNREYIHHLVYELTFDAMWDNGMPARYYTLVDAHTAEVLYRSNEIHSCHASACGHGGDHSPSESTPVAVNASFSADHIILDPSEPTTTSPFVRMDVIINGTEYVTSEAGAISTGESGPVDATVRLRGTYARVRPNGGSGATPETVISLAEGENDIDLSDAFGDEQISAFINTNIIHDFMKEAMPDFTAMDFELPVNIGISPHECNAFYDGSSINFYVGAAGCVSLVLVSDVVFHEYGHGINRTFYQSFGSNYNNGGMNEGYADFWGYMVYLDPVLGDGNNPTSPDAYIRRYDQDPKVYPEDLTGAVHGDGEIIAGSWWDTYLLLGEDEELIMELFQGAYTGLQATASNGDEGAAFLDVLIDALEYDDDDANILNGTPNGDAIAEGFAMHGITFLATAELDHEAILFEDPANDILIETGLDFSVQFTPYLDGVYMNYKTSPTDAWMEIAMTEVSDGNYEASIPGQPAGTIISYFMAVRDIFNNLSAVTPVQSHIDVHPNLPNYILVGYEQDVVYDADDEDDLTEWAYGNTGDNATTGLWEEVFPVGSFSNGITVAVDQQFTEGGANCIVTGNSSSINAGVGENDVDGGTTTLISDFIDMTNYTDPAFTYMRWYTNSPPTGANPGADWWQVQVSDDGGDSWVYVEDTKASDASWRRYAFRILDYVDLTDEFLIKFNASDSLRPGQNLDGGSLIEAGLDDFIIYDVTSPSSLDEVLLDQNFSIFPNPASDELEMAMMLNGTRKVTSRILDVKGSLITEIYHGNQSGEFRYRYDVKAIPVGIYHLEFTIDNEKVTKTFNKE
ncbi:MAG: hypothetical protein O2867_04755 [Bacteroidetes bacterium]|nr:hypothetical protein [Bacteroidota bacterium]